MELGDQVVAIGNALGEGQSATVGYISALNRSITIDGTEYSNLIMTDAAINPGNSGGALLNAEGRVIGINSAKSAQTDVEGMGYAIPISSVRDILDNLMTKKTRQKVSDDKASYLGISGVDVTSSIAKAYGYPQGILLQKVEDGSAASKAGLLKNDIITSFDGETVSSFTDLKNLMKYYESGETVTIEYYRVEKGEYVLMSVDVTLGHNSN
jgi:serine protease Do